MKIDRYYKKISLTEFAKYLLINSRELITDYELRVLKNIEPNLELVNDISAEFKKKKKYSHRLRVHEDSWIKIIKLEEDYFVVGIYANATSNTFKCDGLLGLTVCLKNEYKGL